MTVKEAAALLEISETTVYDLIALKKIAHYRIGKGRAAPSGSTRPMSRLTAPGAGWRQRASLL